MADRALARGFGGRRGEPQSEFATGKFRHRHGKLPSPLSPGTGNSYTASFFRDSRDRPADHAFSCAAVATTSKQKVGSMLKLMRDSFHHLKWILLAIVAAFIICFVYVDMGLGGANQTKQQYTRAYDARVNGETISFRQHDPALYYSVKHDDLTY